MRGDFKFVCTGNGSHKSRELYSMTWQPDDLVVWDAQGEPLWVEMHGSRARNAGRLVSTTNCDVKETPEGLAYRFSCPSCRPKSVLLWHTDLEKLWDSARHAGKSVADISVR